MTLTISTIKMVPRHPNEYPKHPYLGSAPFGNSLDNSTKISPISGVKITDKINAKPKPIFLRLPNKPTRTSSRICPESNPKSKILENIVLFVKNYLSFATVECSERKLFAGAVGKVELTELLLCGRTEHLVHECAGNGR